MAGNERWEEMTFQQDPIPTVTDPAMTNGKGGDDDDS